MVITAPNYFKQPWWSLMSTVSTRNKHNASKSAPSGNHICCFLYHFPSFSSLFSSMKTLMRAVIFLLWLLLLPFPRLAGRTQPPKIEFLDKILDGQPCRGSHLRSMFWIYSLVMLSLRKLRAKQASQSFSQDSLQVSTRKPNSNIMWSSSAATLSHLEMKTGIIIIISSLLAHCTRSWHDSIVFAFDIVVCELCWSLN